MALLSQGAVMIGDVSNPCPICGSDVSPFRHWHQGVEHPGELMNWRCREGHELAFTANDVRDPPLTAAKAKQLEDFLAQERGEVQYTPAGKRRNVKDPRIGKPMRCFDTACKSTEVELLHGRHDLLWCGKCEVTWVSMPPGARDVWHRNAAEGRKVLAATVVPVAPSGSCTDKLPGRFSFSSMEKFLNCPQAWYRRYILKLPDPGGWDAVVGSFVHACLEVLVPFGRRQVNLDLLRLVARELWGSVVEHQAGTLVPAGFDDRMSKDIKRIVLEEHQGPDASVLPDSATAVRVFKGHAWERASRLTGHWLTHAAVFGEPFLLDSKHSLEADLSCRLGDVEFSGFGDFLGVLPDQSVSVSDWKSGKSSWYAPAKAVKRHQLQLYMAAVQEKFGYRPARSQFLYANHPEVQVTTVDPTEAPIGVEKLNVTWAEVRSCAAAGPEAFVPKPGPLCSWCVHATSCPVGAKAVKVRMAGNKKDGPMAAALMALPQHELAALMAAA